jgi:hypothetical protein
MTSRMAYGGKTVYGARLGFLILPTNMPRIPGDAGNAGTWPFPVLYRIVRGATAKQVAINKSAGLLDAFIEAAKELVAMGAEGLGTTGGYLTVFQKQIAEAAGVPVGSSSLMQIPLVQKLLPPGKRVGIITVNGASLDADHLRPTGAPLDTPIVGTENGRVLTRALLGNEPEFDVALAEQDMLDAGTEMREKHPDVGAIVIECANMAAYSRALSQHTGLPVYDIYSFLTWFHGGLAPRDFGHPGSAPRPFRER